MKFLKAGYNWILSLEPSRYYTANPDGDGTETAEYYDNVPEGTYETEDYQEQVRELKAQGRADKIDHVSRALFTTRSSDDLTRSWD